VFIFILGGLLLIPPAAIAQPKQTTAGYPDIAQPLIREGDFALDLAEALKLGTPMNEAEAESALISVGISPRNGWISDYPVTPDIIEEVQVSISEAAAGGTLAMGKDTAMAAFQEIIKGYDMPVRPDNGQWSGKTPSTNYPGSEVLNDYYYTEGAPVVTYYAPPPDYAYLYTWVPYPFWWWDDWFPGFFVLVDFDVRVHGHEHRHGHGGEFITNHYRDIKTGNMMRIDPTNRFRGGIFAETEALRGTSPSVQRGAQAILNRTEAYGQSRGYGVSRPLAATRSSAFDRSDNSRFERAASDRGFQSRSTAGQIPARGATSGGVSRSGGGGGYHGGGGGGSHGGGGGRSR
jgi:uncharacterized membrane protein YgcG